MPISNQKEEIDSRILRLIGLEDVFDLDYETYLTLLKEAMIKSRMTEKTIPTEEIVLLTDEYKRVKSRKENGRFEIKKKKISAESFSIAKVKGTLIGSKSNKGLLAAKTIARSPLSESLENNISAIASSIVSISETLNQQKRITDASSEYERKKSEKEKRTLEESKLEKRFEGLKKVAEKIIAPVKSLLDRVLEFFTTVILGRIVYKLVEWMGDPKNASKVKSIIRFVKDWWPALLGSYILFGNSFSGLIRSTIGIVGRFIFQIGRVAIPQLLGLIRANPLIAAGAITGLAAGGAEMWRQKEEKNQIGKEAKKRNVSPEVVKQEKTKSDSGFLGLLGQGFGKMGPLGYAGGGFASGYVSGEKGVDKVPAMLSDGEFVMSRGAVEKYGVDTLEAMNSAGGGTNKPKIIGGKTYAAGGGLIGKSEYYIDEILKGLAPQYKWAENLAKRSGSLAQNTINQSASNTYNFGMNQGARAQEYLTKGGLDKDIAKLMRAGGQFGSDLYNQALKVGNKALSDIQSGRTQKRVANTLSQTSQIPKQAGSSFFDFMSNISSSQRYKEGSKRIENVQGNMISLSDKFIKNLPDGPFKEMADKGLIPIPSGNATIMRNLTFVKAMLGPLGAPFKILSNKEVDNMRRKTIENTMNKNGLIVDPKTGEVKMNWNQEDINRGARGGGAYTDKLGPRGSAFNSILGRFNASTEGKGNTLYSDDRYNFNKTVGEYAGLAKTGLLKGSMSDATYYGASMLGRFAQDIGWLNQRALGSRIKIGTIDRNRLSATTGKYLSKEQAEKDKRSGEEKKIGGGSVKLYDKPQKYTGQYQSRFARSKNAGVRPVNPPPKPTVKIVRTKADVVGKGNRAGTTASTRTPNFSASTKGWRTRTQVLGLMR